MIEHSDRKKFRRTTVARIIRSGAEGDAASERKGLMFYDHWDSDARNFDAFFQDVLIPFKTIKEYMEATYEKKKGQLIGAELGGPARKLFQGLNEDHLFDHTVGFVLHDHRNSDERDVDTARYHDVIEADVFFKDGADGLSWRTVEEWVSKHGKPDLVVERMVQGIDLIRRADIFAAIVSRWHSVLAEGGTMLLEVPKPMSADQLAELQRALEWSPKFVGSEFKFSFNAPNRAVFIRRQGENS